MRIRHIGRLTLLIRSSVIAGSLLLYFSFANVSMAYAHKVYIFAWLEGDIVHTDSYFPDKRKVLGGTIRVYDPAKKQLLEGKTDKNGAFNFKIPKMVDLRIVLDASMGHKAEFILTGNDFSGIHKGSETIAGERKELSDHTINIDQKKIKEMLEITLDKRLKPMERALVRLQQEKGPGLTEIIGGIGYIIGIMGIVLYFKNREKK